MKLSDEEYRQLEVASFTRGFNEFGVHNITGTDRDPDGFDWMGNHKDGLTIEQRNYRDFVRQWVKDNAGSNVDDEQATAIGEVSNHVQVIARAGSGKTATLVNRAVFLQKHCSVASSEMLLLAFNRKASKEMKERLEKLLGSSIPHVMTFHALARAIVQPKQEIIYNDSVEENQGLDSVFGDVIRDRLLEDEFLDRVRTLMLAQFKEDWDAIVEGGYDLSPVELLRYRRNLARETLRGEYVKSYGEKVIANFLFEHGIPYNYEKVRYWDGKIYKPDFTLLPCSAMSKGVIIEYYGLANTDPDYDAQIIEKRDYWAKDDKYLVIELTPNDFSSGIEAFEATLQDLLENAGITCNRLPEEQVWLNIKPRAIKRFSSAMSGFVGRCRKMWLLPDDLKQMIAAHQSLSKGEDWFLDLAVTLYSDYLERLEANNQEDFDGLMQAAVSIVEAGATRFERRNESGDLAKLRYVFVDEFQDFSELFQRLMEAVRKHNQDVKFFCVGDDWQAINGFAGSNLKFYENFDAYFPGSKQLHLSTNYRSVSSVVTVGNALMASYGKPARAHNKVEGIVRIVNLSQFSPTIFEEDKYKNGTLTPVILRLAGKALKANKSVVLLSRRKDLFIPSGGSITIDKYLEILRKEIPKEWRDRIIISTAHSFKGRQGDVVIVMDAFERNYPLIHPNWVFARILGESLQQIDDENRRLFYVNLTRAKEALFIITEDGKMSPYLHDIKNFVGIPELDWEKYPPITGSSDNLVVRISGYFHELTDELKADGFQFRRIKGKPVRDKIFIKKEFSIRNLEGTTWALKALSMPDSRFEVSVLDGFNKLLDSYSVVCGKWRRFCVFEVESNDVAPLVVKDSPPIAKKTQKWVQDGNVDCPF